MFLEKTNNNWLQQNHQRKSSDTRDVMLSTNFAKRSMVAEAIKNQ
jgi:hypothetical protein